MQLSSGLHCHIFDVCDMLKKPVEVEILCLFVQNKIFTSFTFENCMAYHNKKDLKYRNFALNSIKRVLYLN